jgi:hypothetical protein
MTWFNISSSLADGSIDLRNLFHPVLYSVEVSLLITIIYLLTSISRVSSHNNISIASLSSYFFLSRSLNCSTHWLKNMEPAGEYYSVFKLRRTNGVHELENHFVLRIAVTVSVIILSYLIIFLMICKDRAPFRCQDYWNLKIEENVK